MQPPTRPTYLVLSDVTKHSIMLPNRLGMSLVRISLYPFRELRPGAFFPEPSHGISGLAIRTGSHQVPTRHRPARCQKPRLQTPGLLSYVSQDGVGSGWRRIFPCPVFLSVGRTCSFMTRRLIGDKPMTGAERQRRLRERLRREREEAARKAGKLPEPSPKEEPSDNQTT